MELSYDSGYKLIYKYVSSIFPQVDKQLEDWRRLCGKAQSELLGRLALSSIGLKKFHAQGGCAYALYPHANIAQTIRFIVSFQTISDYLDNLCDRAGVQDEKAFRQLHLSMLDAVDPSRQPCDYYLFYPHREDNGYLQTLVEECRNQVSSVPGYHLVKDVIKHYVGLYSDLQCYKHLAKDTREQKLSAWAAPYILSCPGISTWEFSAAAGSTLGVFVLYAAAWDPSLTEAEVFQLELAYFPWICGLHILLDYYIDAQEDMQTGDLNFTYYYENLKQCEERLSFFVQQSLSHCSGLKYPEFHTTVIRGLLAMYLSDPKASSGMNKLSSGSLLKTCGTESSIYYNLCRLLRFTGVI